MNPSHRIAFLLICLILSLSTGFTEAFIPRVSHPVMRPNPSYATSPTCGRGASLSSSPILSIVSIGLRNGREDGYDGQRRDDKQQDGGQMSAVALPPRGVLCLWTKSAASAVSNSWNRAVPSVCKKIWVGRLVENKKQIRTASCRHQLAVGLRRVLLTLVLALWIWQRSLFGGNMAWATVERADPVLVATRPTCLWTRIVRGSEKADSSSAPSAGGPSAPAALVASSGGGDRDSTSVATASSSPSLMVSSPATTASAVATLTAAVATTVAVVRRVDTDDARRLRLAQNQKRIRRAFQSNLKRILRHEPEEDDDDDDPVMTKRFRFLRAKYQTDEILGAEDGDTEGTSRDALDFDQDQYGSSTNTATTREDHRHLKQLRKKSEQEYVQALLNRVKQANGGVPSMRRTPRPTVDPLEPQSMEQGRDDASERYNSAVQNLKSISSISPSFEVNDDLAVRGDEGALYSTITPLDRQSTSASPSPSPSPLQGPAVVTPGDEAERAAGPTSAFLHEVDQAFSRAFDRDASEVPQSAPVPQPPPTTSPADVPSRHEVDEAYVRAFDPLQWAGTGDDTVLAPHETSPVAFTSRTHLHPVDEAYTQAFDPQALSRSAPKPDSELEVPAVAPQTLESVVEVQDLALTDGAVVALPGEEEAADVKNCDGAFEGVLIGSSLTNSDSDPEYASGKAPSSAIQEALNFPAATCYPVETTSVARRIRVLDSLESLVDSNNTGIAEAATEVLAEVDAASYLADRLKAARKTIETTAMVVDAEENEPSRDEGFSMSDQVVESDGLAGAVDDLLGNVDQVETSLTETTSVIPDSGEMEPSSLMIDSADDKEIDNKASHPIAGGAVESDVTEAQSNSEFNESTEGVADESLLDGAKFNAHIDFIADLVTEDTLEELPDSLAATAELSMIREECFATELNYVTKGGIQEVTEQPAEIGHLKENVLSIEHSDTDSALQNLTNFGGMAVENVIPEVEGTRNRAEFVDSFPGWIRDRVRTKRQHQRERSRSKRMLEKVNSTSKVAFSAVAVNKLTPSTKSVSPIVENDVVIEKTCPKMTSESPNDMKSLSNAEAEHLIPNPSSSPRKQHQRNKRDRPRPKTPADSEALARKYAEIPSLEERAFAILKDLGMLEVSDDTTP